MNLYLIRHSISEKLSPPKRDYERELTSEGIALISKASAGWLKIISGFDLILFSPLVRAEQTARIIAENFGIPDKLIKENNLAAGCSTGTLIDTLLVFEEKENIAIVGHQPDLSYHIVNFCGSGNFKVSFPPAMIAKINFEGKIKFGNGRLEFLIPAETY